WERVVRQDADPECGCKSCRYQLAVGEGREIDKAYAVWQPWAHALGNGQCDRGLADTSRARDGDKMLLRKPGRQRFYHFRSTEQPRHGLWGYWLRRRVHNGIGLFGRDYLADKGIAASCGIADIAPPLLAIAQRFPQRGDMHTQGPLLDGDIGPQPRAEGLFG